MLHFAFFFLWISFASRNKIAFCSGLRRALERLLLQTKSSSALFIGGKQRNHGLKYESDCVHIGIGVKKLCFVEDFARVGFVEFLSSTLQ
jgi:hypothetical protein